MVKNKETKPTITLCWVISILWLPVPFILKMGLNFTELSVGFFLVYLLPYWIFLGVTSTYFGTKLKTYLRKNYPEEEELKTFGWTIFTYYNIYHKYKDSSDIELNNRAIRVMKIYLFGIMMLFIIVIYSIIFLSM